MIRAKGTSDIAKKETEAEEFSVKRQLKNIWKTRFSKKDDKGIATKNSLFQEVVSLSFFLLYYLALLSLLIVNCKEYGLSIEQFINKEREITKEMLKVLKIIKKKIGWKRSKNILLQRIQKIGNNSKFSVRENKLLRKLINQQRRNGYTSFEEILDHFPGKTIEILQTKYSEKSNYLTLGVKNKWRDISK